MFRNLHTHNHKEIGHLSASNRTLIAKLSRASKGGIITVPHASAAMGLPQRTAALKLAALARRGWLVRARRGMYLVLPLDVEPGQRTVAEDPWVLAREAFSPCYIGGWSAAEHWGLTEQLFRSTLVVTASHTRKRTVALLGHEFHLFTVPAARIEGTGLARVWRGSEQVPVSTPERTIVDSLRHPELCGGVRTLADMMHEYGDRKERRFDKLVAEAEKVASGAAWKRLGYLAEKVWPDAISVASAARKHVSMGNSRLDPSVRRHGALTRRWRLWVNVPVAFESRTS